MTGTAKFGSRRAEAFELKSRDEGEFGERTEGQPREGSTFWVRSNSDEESRASGDGDIMKTVRVSVKDGVRTDLHDRERSRTESIVVKLDV